MMGSESITIYHDCPGCPGFRPTITPYICTTNTLKKYFSYALMLEKKTALPAKQYTIVNNRNTSPACTAFSATKICGGEL